MALCVLLCSLPGEAGGSAGVSTGRDRGAADPALWAEGEARVVGRREEGHDELTEHDQPAAVGENQGTREGMCLCLCRLLDSNINQA